jgi:hypothetical protein
MRRCAKPRANNPASSGYRAALRRVSQVEQVAAEDQHGAERGERINLLVSAMSPCNTELSYFEFCRGS